MTSENSSECKLCREHRPLCKSHIVPELAYAPLKNEKNQIYVLGRAVKKLQTGYFERLLCSECETRLSTYETTFQQNWMDTIPSDFRHLQTKPMADVIEVDVGDFAQFKLFHLSVFWRAAVSSGFKIHDDISLGPFERQIADMLLSGNAGLPGQFPFIGILKLDESKRPVADITQLARGSGRFETHHYYMMSYAYCDWIFVVTLDGPDWLTALETTCRQNGVFLMPTIPHKEAKSVQLGLQILRKLRH